ncbi:hypothetical protein ACJMK2_020650 [Sinanodonta woodiana]|uniref:Farnesyl pyrophosphate synthase n=1 Tax=Sinanodonta woodiana TaxID=1069815 RepID=A0ABD3U053_SINWO
MSQELDLFDAVFPELVTFLTEKGLNDPEIADASKWFKEVLEYNVPYGKKNRGISVITSYRMLVPNSSDEELHIARVLGWCIEWLQAFFLVADDIMDASQTRRGKPCWYKRKNVNNIAINDTFYMEACIYQILKHYCKEKPYYVDLMELFHEVTMQTIHGQCLDLITAPPEGSVDFSLFTLERYDAIVKWKTAFYSFYLPVAIAFYMAGITDEKSHSNAKVILLQMGHFFQVQDDYLDCFGDPVVIGKIGTDIEENKCSWLVVTALRHVNEEQRQILKDNYGRHDAEKVAQIKLLYKDLEMEKLYRQFEDSSYDQLLTLINQLNGPISKDIFITFAEKIYKRNR